MIVDSSHVYHRIKECLCITRDGMLWLAYRAYTIGINAFVSIDRSNGEPFMKAQREMTGLDPAWQPEDRNTNASPRMRAVAWHDPRSLPPSAVITGRPETGA